MHSIGRLLAAVALCVLSSCGLPPSAPTDVELLSAFPARKASLEQLVAMIQADPLDPDKLRWLGRPAAESAQETGLAPARLDEYRAVMAAAGVVEIRREHAQTQGPLAVAFYCGRYASNLAAQNKGYAYLPLPPVLNEANHVILAESMDDMDVTTQYTAYKPIEGNWYLYYLGGD